MTTQNKQELIKAVIAVLETTIKVDEQPQLQKNTESTCTEMLTVKECSKIVSGLSEHTVRKWVAQNKLPHFRAGEGNRGKILIPKTALLEFLQITV